MGVTFAQKAGTAPEIEDGIYDARFDGVRPEAHPEWAGPNKFGGTDDGNRWKWAFTILDETDGTFAVLYDEGEPVEVDTLTNQSVGKKSNGYAILRGLLTTGELALLDAGEPLDGDSLTGRRCQVVIEHNDKGWPRVVSVITARKVKVKASPKAAE